MKDWIPVISAVLGFFAGISGTWLTQRSSRQLERDRWAHEEKKALGTERIQYNVQIAEHIEGKIAWLQAIDTFGDRSAGSALSLQNHEIATKIRLFSGHVTGRAWELFQETIRAVNQSMRVGNVEIDSLGTGTSSGRARPANDMLIPLAVVRGLVVICTVRDDLDLGGDDDLEVFVRGIKYELPTDRRYRQAYDLWWQEFEKISDDDPWFIQSRQLMPGLRS